MGKRKYQSGSSHMMIIVVILVLALIGALGFVYYQNFIQKDDSQSADTTSTTSTTTTDQANGSDVAVSTITYNTFTDSLYDISFKYPDTWTLTPIDIPMAEDPYWNRSLEVINENGEIVAKLILGLSGIGGTCVGEGGFEITTTYSVLESSLSSIESTKPVSASFIVNARNDGVAGYNASYGLTDTYTNVGDYQVCMFYNLFRSNLKDEYDDNRSIVFGNGFSSIDKNFASIDEANQYIQSDEYKEIKKMLLSLTF